MSRLYNDFIKNYLNILLYKNILLMMVILQNILTQWHTVYTLQIVFRFQ